MKGKGADIRLVVEKPLQRLGHAFPGGALFTRAVVVHARIEIARGSRIQPEEQAPHHQQADNAHKHEPEDPAPPGLG